MSKTEGEGMLRDQQHIRIREVGRKKEKTEIRYRED